MSISVANFILKNLRPVLPNAVDYPDATLGYWIDQALIDISRTFPRKTYASWNTVAAQQSYAYADSLTVADESTIIRVLDCFYPWVSDADPGDSLIRKAYPDSDFFGGKYYDVDNDFQMLYVGPPIAAAKLIYCNCHIVWLVQTTTIINPPEHLDLIKWYCVWQAVTQQLEDAMTTAISDPALIAQLSGDAHRAEDTYRSAYQVLNEAKPTSGITKGWKMDKWDERAGE